VPPVLVDALLTTTLLAGFFTSLEQLVNAVKQSAIEKISVDVFFIAIILNY
jgi:hypothetical protein